MSLILNIDTSSYNSSIAISDEDKIIAYSEADSLNHTQVLLPAINKLLDESGYVLKDLSAIAVNIGPGSYTGLRVGISAAKGICYSLDLPLIPVSGLLALAYATIEKNNYRKGAYVVLDNNHRGGRYYAVYDKELNSILPMGGTDKIDDLFLKISLHPIFICDNKYKGDNNIICLPPMSLNALNLAPLALSLLRSVNKYDISSVQPLYINSLFSPQ